MLDLVPIRHTPIEPKIVSACQFALQVFRNYNAAVKNFRNPKTLLAEPVEARNTVASLTKGLRVLEAFDARRPEMSVSQVANQANLNVGTAFRMLNTLVAAGYVEKISGTKRFRLTLKVTDLGFRAIAHMDLRDIARPVLRRLVQETNEAASLGILNNADIIYVERVRAGHTRLGIDIRIGTTIPAYCSAIGHSLLAFLPDDFVKKTLQMTPRSDHAPIMPMDRGSVAADLARVRELGFAFSESYITEGLQILAVPVLDSDGWAVAALSVAAPKVLLSAEEMLATALEPILAAADEIATALSVNGTVLGGHG